MLDTATLKHARVAFRMAFIFCGLLAALLLYYCVVHQIWLFAILDAGLLLMFLFTAFITTWRVHFTHADDDLLESVELPFPAGADSVDGFVYLIQDTTLTKWYKIGKTNDLNRRLNTFHVKLPIETEVIHTIPCADYSKAEKLFHRCFSDKRRRGGVV